MVDDFLRYYDEIADELMLSAVSVDESDEQRPSLVIRLTALVCGKLKHIENHEDMFLFRMGSLLKAFGLSKSPVAAGPIDDLHLYECEIVAHHDEYGQRLVTVSLQLELGRSLRLIEPVFPIAHLAGSVLSSFVKARPMGIQITLNSPSRPPDSLWMFQILNDYYPLGSAQTAVAQSRLSITFHKRHRTIILNALAATETDYSLLVSDASTVGYLGNGEIKHVDNDYDTISWVFAMDNYGWDTIALGLSALVCRLAGEGVSIPLSAAITLEPGS